MGQWAGGPVGHSAGQQVAFCLPCFKKQTFTYCLNVGKTREANLNSSNMIRMIRIKIHICYIPNWRCLIMYSYINDSLGVLFDFSWLNDAYQHFSFFLPIVVNVKIQQTTPSSRWRSRCCLSRFNTWDCKGYNTPVGPQPYNRRITAVLYLLQQVINSAFLTVQRGWRS